MSQPFIIGVSGGSCSGKSAVCQALFETLGEKHCTVLDLSLFYKNPPSLNSQYTIGHPELIDFQSLQKVLECLRLNQSVSLPLSPSQDPLSFTDIFPAKIVLIEGNMILYNENIRNLLDLKIFVRTDDDERLARKVLAGDLKQDELVEAIQRYRLVEKPMFERFVAPTIRFADIIIPRGVESRPALDLLRENLKGKE